MQSGFNAHAHRLASAPIGTRNHIGTIRSNFTAEAIVSRQLGWPGAIAIAHRITGIKGESLVGVRNFQMHFSWNTGFVDGIAWAGGREMQYDNRSQYMYVVSSPIEIEFNMKKSNFNELAIEFDGSFLSRCNELVEPDALEIPDTWDYQDPLCWQLGEVIYNECEAGAPSGRMYGETAMTLLALQVVKNLATRHRSGSFYTRGGLPPNLLTKSCDYMILHLHEDISLHEIAEIAGLSPGHFAHAFKISAGIPPHQWLRRKRIERAKELLRNKSMTIAAIASCVGYRTQSAFGVAFKKETGRAPLDWRWRL
jgi:AraC family transcriptional regulator